MRSRRHLRQLSKSELAYTTRTLMTEREMLLASQARRWRRSVRRWALSAFLLGVGLGALAAQQWAALDSGPAEIVGLAR